MATAAIAPFAGAMSDLVGRRYIALLGSGFIIIGMIVVGTAQRMDVAIGGTAIAGVGGALAELVGFAGIAELAPVRSRGKYLGTALLFSLPFSASQTYGRLYSFILTSSSIICFVVHLAMGCLDISYSLRHKLCHVMDFLSSSSSTELGWAYKTSNDLAHRFCGGFTFNQWIRHLPGGTPMGRIQLVSPFLDDLT